MDDAPEMVIRSDIALFRSNFHGIYVLTNSEYSETLLQVTTSNSNEVCSCTLAIGEVEEITCDIEMVSCGTVICKKHGLAKTIILVGELSRESHRVCEDLSRKGAGLSKFFGHMGARINSMSNTKDYMTLTSGNPFGTSFPLDDEGEARFTYATKNPTSGDEMLAEVDDLLPRKVSSIKSIGWCIRDSESELTIVLSELKEGCEIESSNMRLIVNNVPIGYYAQSEASLNIVYLKGKEDIFNSWTEILGCIERAWGNMRNLAHGKPKCYSRTHNN